jgi:hypothetical protein
MCSGEFNGAIEIFLDKENGLVLRVYQDNDPESPREGDNFGKMVLWHRAYDLGDKHDFKTSGEFLEFTDDNKITVMLPVFAYEHTGMCLSVDDSEYPFNDRFDAGQIGFIYMPNETLEKEFNGDKEAALKHLKREVETYSAYCNNEVFSYTVSKAVYDENGEIDTEEEGEFVSGICGYYGEDHEKSGLFEAAEWTGDKEAV